MSLHYSIRRHYDARLLSCAMAVAALPIFLLSGCGKSSDTTPSTPAPTDDAGIIATVNGVSITRDEMYSEMEQYVPEQLQNFPQNPMVAYPAGRVALQHLITNELLVQLAEKNQVPVTVDEVEARYDDVKMVKETQSTMVFEDLLSDQGLTKDQFDYSTIAPDVAQFNLVSKGITATDQELRAYYTSHIADYTKPDRVHIERIVLLDEASAQKAYDDASKTNSLDDVMSQNIAPPLPGGTNAADIAQWISLDSPPAELKQVLPLFSTSKPGTVLKPFKVLGQWWLAKLDDRKTREVLPFDSVRHIVQWNVETSKASAAGNFQRMQSDMLDMTQQAVITVKPTQYISLVQQLKNPPAEPPAPVGGSQPGN